MIRGGFHSFSRMISALLPSSQMMAGRRRMPSLLTHTRLWVWDENVTPATFFGFVPVFFSTALVVSQMALHQSAGFSSAHVGCG